MKKITDYLKRNIDIILGLIFIFYFICLIFLSKLYFKYIFFILGIGFIIYHFVKDKLKIRRVFKYIKIVFISLISLLIITEVVIAFYPKRNTKECDYIIVLGALVDKNKPSKTLKDRLDAAIEYLNKNENDTYIVVSGGQGRGENISEAEAMKIYLIENNVDEKIIIKEDKSTTTEENFKNSKVIIENHSKKKIENLKIKIVTTDFHSFRSSLMAKHNNLKNYTFYTSKSKYYLAPLNYFREFFAIAYYIFIN